MSDYYYEDERVLEWLELVEPQGRAASRIPDTANITSVASLFRSTNISGDDAQSIEFEEFIPGFEELYRAVKKVHRQVPQDLEGFLRSHLNPFGPNILPQFTKDVEFRIFADLAPDVEDLTNEIKLCKRKRVTEDEWSDRLVFPMLRLAQKRLRTDLEVEIATVKSIGISPPALLPVSAGIPASQKRVDYSLCFQLDNIRRLRRVFTNLAGDSLNQCQHPRLWNHVLLSHVKVKGLAAEGPGDAQLGVWTAAGVKRIQEMQKWNPYLRDKSIATQPLWLWKGDNLTLYASLMSEPGEPEELLIYELAEWHLEEPAQLVTAIICLSRVMEWSLTKYLPWFKKLIQYDN
ncbi:hypothetical protein G647_10267 [Cladophialophora carrionii CBS 160.54]|uniref:PD-(D/E)XK nuclease-like domain-containing protein n=1 Tax=Cladophialophora carrionii CBS 160.54 TaxID=1279043 RepID=V9DJC3_9EURO|nr:uncharacterized protein G647_10267 [Cladophialophora carrionii CBS 160.54]ETI26821.1 hypothetical protein G647_10267 [Cladophialophora carrionii CBS 160.54]